MNIDFLRRIRAGSLVHGSCFRAALAIFQAGLISATAAEHPAIDVASQSIPFLFQIAPQPVTAGHTEAAGQPPASGHEFGEQLILRRRAHVDPWTTSIDALVAYTNNAALSAHGGEKEVYLRAGAAVAYTNRIKGPLFLDLSLQHFLFRYAKFDTLDFDHTRFEAGFLFQLAWLDDAFLFTRYACQRIGEPFGAKLFQSQSLVFGVQKVWRIARGQQLFAGLSADLPVATEGGNRTETLFSAGYAVRLTERTSAQLSYRFGWYDYQESSREDCNQIAVAGLGYEATDWLRLSSSVSFNANSSNRPFAEYHNLVATLGFNVHFSF